MVGKFPISIFKQATVAGTNWIRSSYSGLFISSAFLIFVGFAVFFSLDFNLSNRVPIFVF